MARSSEIVQLLYNFENMTDGHLDPIKTAIHWNELKLQEEFIELASTGWASLIAYALKHNGSLKFCVDHFKLNTVTVRDF